jgi:tRNA A37 threonylcarbamoyladenosine dehydratase
MKRKIMIIGAGGIGSFLVSNLARVGIYDITVFDDDKVESKNLLHQWSL